MLIRNISKVSYRVDRFSSTLKQCLADILINEIDDSELKHTSIIDIVVSDDLKKAKVIVSSFIIEIDNLISKLTKAKGFIKKSLAQRMYLKYIPDLIFVKDSLYELNNKIPNKNK